MTKTTGHLPAGEPPCCTNPKCSAPRWGDSIWCRGHAVWVRASDCVLCGGSHSFEMCPHLPARKAVEKAMLEHLGAIMRAVHYDMELCPRDETPDPVADALEEVADRMEIQHFTLD